MLTHDAALQGRSSLTLSAGGRRFEGRVVVYEAATGLALLETEPSGAPTVKVSELAPAAGMLTLGVGRTDDGDVAIPLFVTSVSPDRYTLGAVNGSIPPGLPVFNVAGELLAITVPEETETRAVPVKAAATRLLARVATGERRWALGLGLQPTADISAGGSGRAVWPSLTCSRAGRPTRPVYTWGHRHRPGRRRHLREHRPPADPARAVPDWRGQDHA